jgi:hypothetical protein
MDPYVYRPYDTAAKPPAPRPQVLFETQAAVVVMDRLAGGSGGGGPVFHGREGDGATLTLDMAVAVRGPAGRGAARTDPVYKAFHGKGAGKGPRNVGLAAQAAAVAGVAAARWAKRA